MDSKWIKTEKKIFIEIDGKTIWFNNEEVCTQKEALQKRAIFVLYDIPFKEEETEDGNVKFILGGKNEKNNSKGN